LNPPKRVKMATDGKQGRVTLEDVARLAGVKSKTASLALRNRPGVSDLTRTRILKAAQELKYSSLPNPRRAARRTVPIGVCIPDIRAAHYGELVYEILHYAWARDYAVIPQTTNDNPSDELRAAQVFKRLGVLGVILTSSRIGEAAVRYLENEAILVVSIVSVQPGLEGPLTYFSSAAILLDHITATHNATKYLISLGHERIAYLGGPRNSSSNAAKCEGYKTALHDAGITLDESWVLEDDAGRSDYAVGYDECLELIRRTEKDRPSAVVCYNDELALGALSCLSQSNIQVPSQMSVVGNDDIKHARHWNPALTTIRVPRAQLAQEAVEMIHEYVETSETFEERRQIIVPKLIVRSSTGMYSSSG
jgi:DNA-binding LacI/PurR family transcriptional regulator